MTGALRLLTLAGACALLLGCSADAPPAIYVPGRWLPREFAPGTMVVDGAVLAGRIDLVVRAGTVHPDLLWVRGFILAEDGLTVWVPGWTEEGGQELAGGGFEMERMPGGGFRVLAIDESLLGQVGSVSDVDFTITNGMEVHGTWTRSYLDSTSEFRYDGPLELICPVPTDYVHVPTGGVRTVELVGGDSFEVDCATREFR